METRYTMGFLALGIACAVVLTPERRFLHSGWLWVGVGISILIWLPNLIWQIKHSFISLEFLSYLHARDLRQGRYAGFLGGQLWEFGWADTFALAMFPIALALLVYWLCAKDSPQRGPAPRWREYAAVLREPDAAWFCFFYSFTFGGFVGFASFLTFFFHDQYALSKVRAGDFTTLVVFAGSFLRPVGGWLSDRIGGYRLLLILLAGVACCLTSIAQLPALPLAVTLLFLSMAMLGMGNGAVFQLVPQRFADRVGILTGLVGAAGGVGGFFLPSLLGAVRQRTGQYSKGLFVLGATFLVADLILLQLGTRWRLSWPEAAAERAGIFSYRSVATIPSAETAD